MKEGARTRWQLSEDPDDRKDGLWVWGLFAQPLYPFIRFELDMDLECRTPDGQQLEGGTFFFQGSHERKDEASVLSEGKVMRRLKVALAVPGADDVTYDEPVQVGTFVARRN